MAQSIIKSPFMDEVITLTVDSTKVSSGSANCIKRNGWCYIFLSDIRLASDGNSQAIISGCPKAIYQCCGVITSENAATSLNYDAFWINTNGTKILCNIGSGNASKRHWVCFAYPYAM